MVLPNIQTELLFLAFAGLSEKQIAGCCVLSMGMCEGGLVVLIAYYLSSSASLAVRLIL